ncbi:MAG: chaperone required for assembly of F1-ATPase [Paracoccaceae bacterium]|jgi:chaperone required for assembly of F1-ATPase
MSDAPARFWQTTHVIPEGDGFTIALDSRAVKTPAKASLLLPTRAMADAVAAEWEAQGNKIDPATMPVTRTANAAIDKVTHQHAEVADMLAAYGDSDLLCYRADTPEELVARQTVQWDPALDWAAKKLGVRLQTRSGVIHQAQDGKALNTLTKMVHTMSPYQLAGFHDLVSLSGSLVLGFSVVLQWKEPEKVWFLSRLDEIWQHEKWGQDDEADALSDIKRLAFLHAARFYEMAGLPD